MTTHATLAPRATRGARLIAPACLSLLTPLMPSSDPTPPAPPDDPEVIAELRARCASAPLVVAHRGASTGFPENTIPAFRAALRAGAPLIELDVRETADGVLVVLHDETLDRTTDAAKVLGRKGHAVAKTRFADIARLDAGAWKDSRFAGTRVPTLEQALDAIHPHAVAMIEHKACQAAALVGLLRRRKLLDHVLVQSFDWSWLQEVRRLEPRLVLGALGDKELDGRALDDIAELGARFVHWSVRHLGLEDVAAFHRRGYLVCVYTVDADVALLGTAPLGLDLVTTNRPERMLELTSRGLLARAR